MKFEELTIADFCSELASSAPVPGGGGVAALVGALGASLGSMVGNLTAGKKKYAQFEEDIQRILKDADRLGKELLSCIDEDARCFEPLSEAYGIPRDAPGRDAVMEEALRLACSAPLSIMRLAAEAILLHRELADKGSALMISDVGVGALCCKTALQSAGLSVYVNLRLMKDASHAAALKAEADEFIKEYSALAEETYEKVMGRLV